MKDGKAACRILLNIAATIKTNPKSTGRTVSLWDKEEEKNMDENEEGRNSDKRFNQRLGN